MTVDDLTIPLPSPFLVIATQNPIELEGTFPLPEAQLDRFLIRIRMGYPDEIQEGEMLARFNGSNPLADLQPVTDGGEILELHPGPDAFRHNRSQFLQPKVQRNDRLKDLGLQPAGAGSRLPVDML